MEDIGEYSCEADNAVGSVVSSGTLIVYCKFLNINATNKFLTNILLSFKSSSPILHNPSQIPNR